jgi:hypothetical protein
MVVPFEVSASILILFYTSCRTLDFEVTAALASSLRSGARQHVAQTRLLEPGDAHWIYPSGNDGKAIRLSGVGRRMRI